MPSALEVMEGPGLWPGGDRRIILRLQLFGRMAAADQTGRSVLPRARKTRALLAILALAAPGPVLRTHIASLLWSQRQTEQARASLRQAVHELQESLGPAAGLLFRAERNHLALSNDMVWVDAHEFARATPSDPAPLDIFRSTLLEDLSGFDPSFDQWLSTERIRLRHVAIGLGESILTTQNEPAAILAAAKRLLAIDAGHEDAWRKIIETHLRLGENSLALAGFERYRAAVALTAGTSLAPDIAARVAEARLSAGRPPNASGGRYPITDSAAAAPRRSGILRIGVMPMRPLDGRGNDPLSLGLAEEITTALSRFRWMSCVASPSVAALADEPVDGDLWQRLNLDFMLDGTIQRSNGRVRITSRLLDMRENGALIWTRRFDRKMTDILALQDDIASETAAQVDPELLLHEGQRARNAPEPPDPTAYELMLRAIPAIYRLEQSEFMAAGEMLRTALAIDRGHAASHAWLAYWTMFLVGQGWTEDPAGASVQGGLLADRAVALDPSDARGLTLSGHVRAFLAKRPEEAILLHQRALSLNPNLPMAWVFSGLAHCYVGRHQEAVRLIANAQRLSPFDPHGFFFDMALTMPYLLTHEHETVISIGRRAIELNPGFSSSYKGVLSALGHLGRTSDARDLLARLLVLEPRLTLEDAISRSPILQPDDLAHYAEGLRLGGLR